MIVYSRCLFLFTDYCLLWRSQPHHWVQTQFNGWMDEWMKTFLTLFILSPWSHLFISALFSGSRESFFQQKSWLNWNAHPKVASRDHRCFVCFFPYISCFCFSSALFSSFMSHAAEDAKKKSFQSRSSIHLPDFSPPLLARWGDCRRFFSFNMLLYDPVWGPLREKNIHKPR